MNRRFGFVLGCALAGTLAVFPTMSAAHGGPGHAVKAAKTVVVNAKNAKSSTLTIVHVQKGCHVWTAGKRQSPNVKVVLKRGARLVIVNHDVDGHQLVQTAGAKLKLARLAMNKKTAISFAKAGTYRLTTRTFEIEGMPEMETIGPDNALRLTIVVT